MSEIIDPQLDYQKRIKSKPSYKFTKILPLQNVPSGNTFIDVAGGQQITFQLPVVAMNLAKSVLHLTVTPAAGTEPFNGIFSDCFPIFRQIQLLNNQGVELCDLQNVQNYTKVVWKAEIPMKEYLNYDTFAGGVGSGRFLRKNNALGTSVAAPDYSFRPTNVAANIHYTENTYLIVGASGTATPVLDISIPLGMLKNTVFDIDKDLYFNEILTLQLTFGSSSKLGYNFTALANPVTGATAPTTANVQNIYLMLATERNLDVVNELKSIVSRGQFNIPIPYVTTIRTPLSSTTQNVALTLTRGLGQRLLKIYHSIFGVDETLSEAYYNSQTGTTLVNFYTQVNDQRLQDFNVVLNNHDDWLIMQKKLEGSVTQNENIYRYNWFWLDDFSGMDSGAEKDSTSKLEVNELKGLDLSTNIYYQFNATTADDNYAHYDFVITQKMMSVSPAGLVVN